jgi:hypothetical protein
MDGLWYKMPSEAAMDGQQVSYFCAGLLVVTLVLGALLAEERAKNRELSAKLAKFARTQGKGGRFVSQKTSTGAQLPLTSTIICTEYEAMD